MTTVILSGSARDPARRETEHAVEGPCEYFLRDAASGNFQEDTGLWSVPSLWYAPDMAKAHIKRHTYHRTRVTRKLRKTYTLSAEAVAILEAEKKTRKAVSSSSALEELLRERQRRNEMQQIAASVTSYYDSLNNKELQEQDLWGEFARSQFPPE